MIEEDQETRLYRTPYFSNIQLNLTFSGPFDPWPNPHTDHSHT